MDQPTQPSGFVSSLARTRGRSWPLRLSGWLSSLWWAAGTIAALGAVIGIATWYERDYGRHAAATMIYTSRWFGLIFALLAINIFGAAAVRYPWTKRQRGFVVVHIGLLTIIAGFYCSRDRLDGMLVAKPGEPASRIELPRDRLALDGGPAIEFDETADAGFPSFARYVVALLHLAPKPAPTIHRLPSPRTLIEAPDGTRVRLRRVVDTARDELGWLPCVDGRPALKVEFTARPPIGIEMPLGAAWLDFAHASERDLSQPGGPPVRVAVGRTASAEAIADFLQPPTVATADGELAIYWRGERRRVALTPAALPQAIAIDDDLRLVVDLYVLRPAFDGGELRDDPQAALDPLLRVRVGLGRGDAVAWSNLPVFARMPCYARETSDGNDRDQPTLLFEHPATYAAHPGGQGLEVQGLLGPDGRLALRWLRDSRGLAGHVLIDQDWSGALIGGDGDPSPMRLTLKATFLRSAEPGPEPVRMRAADRERARRWLELEVERAGASARTWIGLYGAASVSLPTGQVRLSYNPAQYDLQKQHGFALELERFIEGKDPGGMGSASFASEVALIAADGARRQRTITMNEPLKERGVVLYQSSFEQQRDDQDQPIPGAYRASVFTVATDPGGPLKYIGSALLVAGILLMYRGLPGFFAALLFEAALAWYLL